MAITSLVIGIVALLTSFVPIINNASFFLALLGLVFGLVGLVATVRGTRHGKVLAVVALLLNVIAMAAVLVSQSAYSAAIDEVTNGPAVTATSSTAASSEPTASSEPAASTDLAPGTAVALANGLTVSVDSVQTGLTNYDGSAVTCVNVTYTNNGSSSASFNELDWKGQTANGVQSYTTYYSDEQNGLSAGTLAAGGTVSGTLSFDGDLTSVLYFASIISSEPTATWAVA
jgi:uncharacterized membrane protein